MKRFKWIYVEIVTLTLHIIVDAFPHSPDSEYGNTLFPLFCYNPSLCSCALTGG